MMDRSRSVVVIGSGAAGTAAARTLAAAGVSVTLVEQDRLGGTCLWRGCMPKKALYHAARTRLEAEGADQFGVVCGPCGTDWEGVLAWKWHAQESYAGDQAAMFASRGIRVVAAPGRFIAPRTIEADGEVLTPDDIVIATGSEPTRPAIAGIERADVSEDALHYRRPPTSLAIIGAGYIAFEFAAIYAAFGTRVTVLHRGEPLRGWDRDIVGVALRRLASLGVEFRSGVQPAEVLGEAGRMDVVLEGEAQPVTVERVLVATGRRPRVAALDLAAGDLTLDERGRLAVDALGRTSDPRVWVAGDAAGGPQHTPAANAQGRHVAEAILGETREPLDLTAMPVGVFTFPQLAQVGLTEQAAQAAALPVRVHTQSLAPVGAAVIADGRDGLVKVVSSAEDGRVLGAQIAAPDASDLIYPYAVAISAGATLQTVRDAPAIHPAWTQAVEWAAW